MRSRPMATQQLDEEGELWFFTNDYTAKVDNVLVHPEVCVTYADPAKNSYVSVSGKAELVRDPAKIRELWRPVLKAWFPQGVDTPGIALLRVDATSAELWDSPTNPVAHLISLAKVALTGKPANPGENVVLDLSDEPERAMAGAGR